MKRTIKFIEAVSQKDRALQTAARAFMIIRFGGTLTPEEGQLFCDVCCLALPMKYRFPRATIEQAQKQVAEARAGQP